MDIGSKPPGPNRMVAQATSRLSKGRVGSEVSACLGSVLSFCHDAIPFKLQRRGAFFCYSKDRSRRSPEPLLLINQVGTAILKQFRLCCGCCRLRGSGESAAADVWPGFISACNSATKQSYLSAVSTFGDRSEVKKCLWHARGPSIWAHGSPRAKRELAGFRRPNFLWH